MGGVHFFSRNKNMKNMKIQEKDEKSFPKLQNLFKTEEKNTPIEVVNITFACLENCYASRSGRQTNMYLRSNDVKFLCEVLFN